MAKKKITLKGRFATPDDVEVQIARETSGDIGDRAIVRTVAKKANDALNVGFYGATTASLKENVVVESAKSVDIGKVVAKIIQENESDQSAAAKRPRAKTFKLKTRSMRGLVITADKFVVPTSEAIIEDTNVVKKKMLDAKDSQNKKLKRLSSE